MPNSIAILTGGTSTEREVAIQSATNVQQALGSRATVSKFIVPEQIDDFLTVRNTIDCVIPVIHGRGGEDGTIQGFLETLGIPYIFSGVTAHALAIDKSKTNNLIRAAGIKVPDGQLITSADGLLWTKPIVIKPVDGGSSVGVTIAHKQRELVAGIQQALKTSASVLLEEHISGREFSVAVIDKQGKTEALPVIAITPAHEFFDYASKYTADLAEEQCPADIPASISLQLQQIAINVHRLIGARHVSRSDFIVDGDGQIWFLEINTIPGMSVLLPKALKAGGFDFGQVLLEWVEDAIGQYRDSTPFAPPA